MKTISYFTLLTVLALSACSSKKENKFDAVGKEEIKVNDGRVEIVNTKSLEQALDVERVKRESAERQAIAWKEDYQKAKNELMQARVALGLPPEKQPCNPCKPGQVTPNTSIQDELKLLKNSRKSKATVEKVDPDKVDETADE